MVDISFLMKNESSVTMTKTEYHRQEETRGKTATIAAGRCAHTGQQLSPHRQQKKDTDRRKIRALYLACCGDEIAAS